MKIQFFWNAILCFTLLSAPAIAEEVLVRNSMGEIISLDIDPNKSFQDVIHTIHNQLITTDREVGFFGNENLFAVEEGKSKSHFAPLGVFLLDYFFGSKTVKARSMPRDYMQPVSPQEKADIRYIVISLASNSWLQLLDARASLKKAGDRVDHVHPFRFLMCIFKDEELKAGVHSIRDRKKIWKEFLGGLSTSLEEEANFNNLKAEFIQDFANHVGVNSSVINASIKGRRWEEFVDLLLTHLPRAGDPNRYNQ
jgi:hypothetical protein